MLVVTRKLEEEIVISDNIRVRVLEVRNGRVRLGISAPPEVRVHRAELLENATRGERPMLAIAR